MSVRSKIQKRLLARQQEVELESRCINVARATGKQSAVEFITQCKFDINKVFESGYTLFYYTVIFNNIELIKYLMNEDVKIDPDQIDQIKFYASKKAKRLIENFCLSDSDSTTSDPVLDDVFDDREFFDQPKHTVVKPRSEPSCSLGTLPINREEQQRLSQREKMKKEIEEEIDYLSLCGETRPSIIFNHLTEGRVDDVINEVLTLGINFNEKFIGDYPLLSCAVIFDNPELVKILIDNGTDKEYQCEDMMPPVNLALLYGSQKVLQAMGLIERTYMPKPAQKKPTPAVTNNVARPRKTSGVMDVFDFIAAGDVRSLKIFLEDQNKSVFESLDKDGLTPLMNAACFGTTGMVEVILQKGGKPTIDNQTDRMKNSAIMFAIHNKNVAMTKRLLVHGASIHLKNAYGKSVVDLAKENFSQSDFVKLFGCR